MRLKTRRLHRFAALVSTDHQVCPAADTSSAPPALVPPVALQRTYFAESWYGPGDATDLRRTHAPSVCPSIPLLSVKRPNVRIRLRGNTKTCRCCPSRFAVRSLSQNPLTKLQPL